MVESPKGGRGGKNGQQGLERCSGVVELLGSGRRGRSGRPALRRWSEKRCRPSAKKPSAARVGKSSYKNCPKVGKLEKGDIAREGAGSTTKLEEASIPKLPNRFASTLARKSTIKLMGLEDMIGTKGRRLPDRREAKE